MPAIFKQIRFDKDISEKENFGIRVIASLIITGFGVILIKVDLLQPIFVALFVVLLASLIWPLERKLFSNWVRVNDIIGDLTFDENMISWINGEQLIKVQYIDILSIDLRYNHIQGRKFAVRDIIHNGLAQIQLITKEGNTETVKFLIEREEQIQTLKPIWKNLYKMGIEIREKMGGVEIKTILFDSGMAYEQIRKLKKELNVDSFH